METKTQMHPNRQPKIPGLPGTVAFTRGKPQWTPASSLAWFLCRALGCSFPRFSLASGSATTAMHLPLSHALLACPLLPDTSSRPRPHLSSTPYYRSSVTQSISARHPASISPRPTSCPSFIQPSKHRHPCHHEGHFYRRTGCRTAGCWCCCKPACSNGFRQLREARGCWSW